MSTRQPLPRHLATRSRLYSRMTLEAKHSDRCHTAGEGDSASFGTPRSTVSSAPENANSAQPESVSGAAASTANETHTWHVGDLPDEILIKIFSHMSFTELVDVVQKVCTRWRRLSQDLELWRDKEYHIRYWRCFDVDTSKGGMTDREAIQTFCDAPNLRNVCMWRGARARVFRALCNRCRRLSELQLHVTQKLSYSVLKNLVEKCSGIHKLRISDELLKYEKFSEAVSHLQHLHMLNLDVHFTESTPALRPLADGCPQLAEIDFGHTTVDMDDLRYFLNAKRNTLKSIHIKWTMAGKRYVSPLLAICADNLERLQFYEFELLVDGGREALTALGSLRNLRELKMMILDPLPPGTAALVFKTGGLPKLRVLDLRGGYGLDDDTVLAISRGCPALRELNIREAELLSAAAFSQIYRLESLEILDVSWCTGLGGSLFPALVRLPRLHTLLAEELAFPKLQPGLSSILELSRLRCLTLNYSLVTGVPFDKFPGKLVSLRELNIRGCRGDTKATDNLTEQMPNLEIHGSIEAEEPASDVEDVESDVDLEEEKNAEPGDTDKVRDDTLESNEDGDTCSRGDTAVWDESSVSVLFLEDA